ncbi:NAD(P)H-dependent oxidoreductase [Rhizobium sp. CG4]|jgi:multimeric flavodoxin WrbA|uniref:flavodoxin family protein n=1 Tax=unclassified Rhizobium TaxID=2613769 RepID=UPI0020335F81|nr:MULTISPECIES: NAD(P)H-dependent oxidoreductase [unclassified Rhizobium]MCM2458709.1 NAD(P)H-dependent oxidoreductase [Rhizobium sp. CG4]MCS4245080.1 multimeric flavodoxin WrbA [Rhizobium sp. BIGb0125]
MPLKALALNGTLKPSSTKDKSSTEKMLQLIADEFSAHDVQTEILRLADYDIKPGVTSDEGDGDAWPEIRGKILAADILVVGTPIWLGHPSSVCKRALERMDAFLEETDDNGRMVSYGKVAAVAVVGNEDGAHHVSAELFQAMNDVGFTLAANAVSYWVGEAMGNKNFVDFKKPPETVTTMVSMLARNTVHLATLLKNKQYPGESAN